MIFNTDMKNILETIEVPIIHPITRYPIWKKTSSSNQPYWGVNNFCEINPNGVNDSCNLADLEWEGNEVYISHTADISKLLQYGLGL